MEWPVFYLSTLVVSFTKDFQRLILGSGGKREVARIGQHFPRFHDPVNLILERLLVFVTALFGKGDVQFRGCPATLAGMSFVDDDREFPSTVLIPNFVKNDRKLLDGRNNDLLAALNKLPQITRVRGMADRGAYLAILLNGVADLLIEDAPIRDNDDRVEERHFLFFEVNELVRQPGDGVRFSATRRMLDKIAMANALFGACGKQLPDNVKLMVARKDLLALLPTGFWVLALYDLSIVLNNVGETSSVSACFQR